MYKFGTVDELKKINLKLPDEVCKKAFEVASMLDEHFGKDRDVEFDDGGFVFIALNKSDLDYCKKHYLENVDIESIFFEDVLIIECKQEQYLDVVFFYGYDYGINLFIPVSLATEKMKEAAVSWPDD